MSVESNTIMDWWVPAQEQAMNTLLYVILAIVVAFAVGSVLNVLVIIIVEHIPGPQTIMIFYGIVITYILIKIYYKI